MGLKRKKRDLQLLRYAILERVTRVCGMRPLRSSTSILLCPKSYFGFSREIPTPIAEITYFLINYKYNRYISIYAAALETLTSPSR